MNFELARKIQNQRFQNNTVQVFVQGDLAKIRAVITPLGGHFRYSAGDIASLTMPLRSLPLLAAETYVKRIEYRTPHFKLLSDSMRRKAHVNEVHAGQPPLTQGYDGAGVVIGIIDTGIDFNNPDFKDSLTGKSRVKYLWDQNAPKSSGTPLPYDYGQVWTGTRIDSGKCTEQDPSPGHGTCTCGLASGNGKASPGHKYMGVAPGADLVVVAMNMDSASSITDAADYIYTAAQALGEPCVINISVGDYSGSHDGKDLQALLLDNLILAQKGRVLVAAAGNEGGVYSHLNYALSLTDTNFTWFRFNTSNYVVEFWADTSNFTNGLMAIGADKNSPSWLFQGHSRFISVKDNMGIIRKDSIVDHSGHRIALIESNTTLQGGTYDISFNILPDSAAAPFNWRLQLTGKGTIDLWDDYSVANPGFGMIYSGIPSTSVFPPMVHYIMPDTLQTICSSFQCSDNVITVGAYVNKNRYVDIKGDLVHFAGLNPDHIWTGSSMGPTRDGRIKPDIAAPANVTITTGVLSLMAQWALSSPLDSMVEQSNYVRSSGTSGASPVVAGIGALYLQQNPNASAFNFKKNLLICPLTDAYTGPVPNYTWGYGKADAFTTLAGCTTGINNYTANALSIGIYPNPFNEQTNIIIDFSSIGIYSSASLRIYDIIGKLVRTLDITNGTTRITLQKGSLESGTYICNLIIDGKTIKSNRLLIL